MHVHQLREANLMNLIGSINLHDITLAFKYLIYQRGVTSNFIILVGVSSRGDVVVLLVQAPAKVTQEFDKRQSVCWREANIRSSGVHMLAGV